MTGSSYFSKRVLKLKHSVNKCKSLAIDFLLKYPTILLNTKISYFILLLIFSDAFCCVGSDGDFVIMFKTKAGNKTKTKLKYCEITIF